MVTVRDQIKIVFVELILENSQYVVNERKYLFSGTVKQDCDFVKQIDFAWIHILASLWVRVKQPIPNIITEYGERIQSVSTPKAVPLLRDVTISSDNTTSNKIIKT